MRDGRRYRQSTGVPVGVRGREAQLRREEAERARDEILAPVQLRDKADRLASLVRREKEAERAATTAGRIPLAEVWERFPYNRAQPGRMRKAGTPLKPSTILGNRLGWEKFVKWATDPTGAGERARVRLAASKHADPRIALQDVTPALAKAYADWLVAQGFIASRRKVLIQVANVEYRLAGVPSPFDGMAATIELQEPESREPFTKEEVRRMLDAAEGEWKGFLAVCYYTGLRAGDAAHLRHANRGWNEVEGRPVRVLNVLTIKRLKQVRIIEHPALTTILEEVLPRRPADTQAYLFPTIAAKHEKDGPGLSKQFRQFMERALGEIQVGEDGTVKVVVPTATRRRAEGMGVRRASIKGLHSFRHSLATESAQAGVPMTVVQGWLGHSSPAITAIYAGHASLAAQRQLVEAVSLSTALPVPYGAAEDPAEVLRRVLSLVEGMTPENFKERRAEVLALAGGRA